MMKVNQNSKMLRRILRKFVSGKSTDAEQEFLDAWETYQDQHHQFFDSISVEERRNLRDEGWARLQCQKDTRHLLQSPTPKWFRYAAVLLVGVSLFTLGYLHQRSDSVSETIAEDSVRTIDIMPGGRQAVLKLPDGREIPLSKDQDGVVFGEQIAYLDGTELAEVNFGAAGQVASLVMETPRGGTYQVTLSDGTRVWLNAESRLIYPTRFDGDARNVELEGEAFFEVSSSTKPFFVQSSDQIIEVLGTEFNISAYGDNLQTTTTLVSGSVSLQNRQSAQVRTLEPGEQAIVREDKVGVRTVDVADYTAWKDGLFVFNDTPLLEVLGQLQRWYGVDLKDEVVPDLHFKGGIRRDVPLSQVLAMLEATTNEIHFDIVDNTLALRSGRRTVIGN